MCTDVIHHERTGYWAFICLCPGFVVYPVKCNSYYMGSSLFSAFNTANLCFFAWFYLFLILVTVVGIARDVLHCGQVVQEEGEEPSAKICYDEYIH